MRPYLTPGPTYERQRLMDKGVYFVMSGKYAHLPMLVAVEKTSNRKMAQTLSAVAQYLLCYHLQVSSLEGMSAKEIAPCVPYSYPRCGLYYESPVYVFNYLENEMRTGQVG